MDNNNPDVERNVAVFIAIVAEPDGVDDAVLFPNVAVENDAPDAAGKSVFTTDGVPDGVNDAVLLPKGFPKAIY